MTCYYPIRMYRSARGKNKETGGWPLVSSPREGYVDMPVDVPCGRCVGCRLERSRQWAIRCMHEASLYKDNCFVTLTYRAECLPPGGTLVKEDLQKFMKRLRKKYGDGIRYYACGEYGSKGDRPHYHLCLFNLDFKDKYSFKIRNGFVYCRSPQLERLWPFGFSLIGALTFESAAYTARYILKKQLGPDAEYIYKKRGVIPEFTVMSRRPGIAHDWYQKYKDEVYPADRVYARGVMSKPPRYYDNLYDAEYPDDFDLIKYRRKKAAEKKDVGPYERHYAEVNKLSSVKRLYRPYEQELQK